MIIISIDKPDSFFFYLIWFDFWQKVLTTAEGGNKSWSHHWMIGNFVPTFSVYWRVSFPERTSTFCASLCVLHTTASSRRGVNNTVTANAWLTLMSNSITKWYLTVIFCCCFVLFCALNEMRTSMQILTIRIVGDAERKINYNGWNAKS